MRKRTQFDLTNVHERPVDAGEAILMQGILAKTSPIYLDGCSQQARRLEGLVRMQGILAKTNPIYLDGRSQRARHLDEVVLVQGILAKSKPIYLDGRSQRARWLNEVVLVQGILAKTKPIYLDGRSQRARRLKKINSAARACRDEPCEFSFVRFIQHGSDFRGLARSLESYPHD
jgi:hypothetical protein